MKTAAEFYNARQRHHFALSVAGRRQLGAQFRMHATDWEFSHRALVFGLIYFVGFQLYALDHATSSCMRPS